MIENSSPVDVDTPSNYIKSTYPHHKALATRIDCSPACYELQQQYTESKHICFLIHQAMHEILWSQIPERNKFFCIRIRFQVRLSVGARLPDGPDPRN